MDTQALTRLLAQAIVAQARRQAEQKHAAPVLAHQDGGAPEETAHEVTPDASSFYATGERPAS